MVRPSRSPRRETPLSPNAIRVTSRTATPHTDSWPHCAAASSTIGLVWADGGYPGRLLIWAKDVLTLTMQIIKRIPRATGFHVRPRIWVVERSFAWINKHRRCARDYETRPDHHEAMVHLAMITTVTRRLART